LRSAQSDHDQALGLRLGCIDRGIAGSLFATRQGFVSPESFTFIETAIISRLSCSAAWEPGRHRAGARFFSLALPEWFRDLEEYRMVAFGAAMVLIMSGGPRD
jgi:branched-chain amino acid transport system permease protein